MASRLPHAHPDGPRRPGDGPLDTRHPSRRSCHPFRRRLPVHQCSLWERLAELGALPSVGSVGDSFDNALAETINGLYKTELIRGPDQGPWRTVEEVELATLSWVHWYNTERLHGYLGDVPPDEYEETHHAQQTTRELIGTNKKSLHQTQGDSLCRPLHLG